MLGVRGFIWCGRCFVIGWYLVYVVDMYVGCFSCLGVMGGVGEV